MEPAAVDTQARARRSAPGPVLAVAGAGALLAAAAAWPHLPDPGPLCLLRRATGIPCPGCGMTTGVVAGVRGHVGEAFAANPLAPFVAALAVALVVAQVVGAVTGRPVGRALVARLGALRPPVVPLLVVVGGVWCYELGRYGLLDGLTP